MFTLLFIILMVAIFGKLLMFALKASWGIMKIVLTFVFLPVILIGLVIAGITYVAIPLLIIVGIASLLDYAV